MKKKIPKDQSKLMTEPTETRTVEVEQFTRQKYTCPFCLHQDYLYKFEKLLKSGKTAKDYNCPECGSRMRSKTLRDEMTVKDYAHWVFDNASFGFWQKINFDKFRKRLNELGIAHDFWLEYHRLKLGVTPGYMDTDWDEASEQEVEEAWKKVQAEKEQYG